MHFMFDIEDSADTDNEIRDGLCKLNETKTSFARAKVSKEDVLVAINPGKEFLKVPDLPEEMMCPMCGSKNGKITVDDLKSWSIGRNFRSRSGIDLYEEYLNILSEAEELKKRSV